MSIKDVTMATHLKAIAQPNSQPAGKTSGFGEVLQTAVSDVNKLQVEADRSVEALQTGQSKNLHETTIALEKADISMRLLVQMRNKVLDAYHEIMRMQV